MARLARSRRMQAGARKDEATAARPPSPRAWRNRAARSTRHRRPREHDVAARKHRRAMLVARRSSRLARATCSTPSRPRRRPSRQTPSPGRTTRRRERRGRRAAPIAGNSPPAARAPAAWPAAARCPRQRRQSRRRSTVSRPTRRQATWHASAPPCERNEMSAIPDDCARRGMPTLPHRTGSPRACGHGRAAPANATSAERSREPTHAFPPPFGDAHGYAGSWQHTHSLLPSRSRKYAP